MIGKLGTSVRLSRKINVTIIRLLLMFIMTFGLVKRCLERFGSYRSLINNSSTVLSVLQRGRMALAGNQ